MQSYQNFPTYAMQPVIVVDDEAASSEWGMRGLQSSYPGLKDRLIL